MKKRGLGRREYPGKISVREGGGRTTEIPTGKEDPGGAQRSEAKGVQGSTRQKAQTAEWTTRPGQEFF